MSAHGDRSDLARPVRAYALDGRLNLFHIATISAPMAGSRARVYSTLKGVAEGKGGKFEWAEVVARSDRRLLCDFWTQIDVPLVPTIRFRTRESVELDPPDTLHYRHRSGPSRGVAETIVVEELSAGRSRVTYTAVYPSTRRVWGMLFAIVARPVTHLFMWIHFRELAHTMESKATIRSR